MLVACRRLLHLPSIRYNSPLELIAIPRSATPSHRHHRLSPEIVDSTVSNCPSDTIALSFFLWAARQPEYFHGPTSFDRIVPVVRRLSHRFGLVSGIVRHLESFGCPIKAQTFLILLRVYWRANMCRFALEVFDTMCRKSYVPNTFARNIVLDIMFKRGCFDDAMRFFREFRFPNFLTYNIVLRSVCKSGDWITVRDLLREMVRKGFDLNEGSFSMALDCFCKAGRHSELLQLFAFIVVLGRRLSVIIWTILIDSLCRKKRFEIALDHMRNMVEDGFLPTVVTYTSVIKGLADAKMFGEVPAILSIMLYSDCHPDIVLFNYLICLLVRTRRYDLAIDLFSLLQKSNLEPDSYTLSSLAFIFFSSQRIDLMQKLVSETKFKYDLVLFNSLLIGYCKAGLPCEALKLYDMMLDTKLIPDKYTYAGLLSSLCKLGRTEQAVHVYHEILLINLDVDAYVHSSILDGLVKNRDYHKAIRLFWNAGFKNYCLDVVSYTIVIHALSLGGRFSEACDLFEQMRSFGPAPNTYTYNVMLRGFCKERDWSGTKKLLKHMLSCGIEIDDISLNMVTHLFFKLGCTNSALYLRDRHVDD